MVMSKVSKAIAASFLCLTINAGGVTNAMKKKEVIENNVNNTNIVDDTAKCDVCQNDGAEEDGKTSIWRWLLPVIIGVGGLAVGICLGKFAC